MKFDPLAARPARAAHILASSAAKTRPSLARQLALACDPPAREAVAALEAAPREVGGDELLHVSVSVPVAAKSRGTEQTSARRLAADVVQLYSEFKGIRPDTPGRHPGRTLAAGVLSLYRETTGAAA